MDRNVTNMPESIANISRKPSEYLKSFYFDTCTYDPSVVTALIARVGADRLVMGSDYAVGDSDPVRSMAGIPHLSAHERQAILGGTAAGLLGIQKCSPITAN